MSRRYLTLDEAERALAAGRTVEQWLGTANSEMGSIISWVDCSKARDGSFRVALFRSIDAGNDAFLDVYAFESADADEAPTAQFENPRAALDHAIRNLGADGEHFVNQGLVQDEYRDHRQTMAARERR